MGCALITGETLLLIRNWTHVSDIVEGTILAAERIHDGTAINLGRMERTRVIDAAREVLRYTGSTPTSQRTIESGSPRHWYGSYSSAGVWPVRGPA